MAKAQRQGWGVIALDVQVDTSTASGEAMANMLATFAQFERRLIGQRTREALAKKREQGVVLGRPRSIPEEVAELIHGFRTEGMTVRAMAARLDADGVRPPGGGVWRPSTLHRVLTRADST